MTSRLLDNVHSSANADLVHPRELGGKCKATAADHDEAQAVWWNKISSARRVAERQMPGSRRGEYGMLLQVWELRSGRIFMVVVDEPGQAPIQFWALPDSAQPAHVTQPAKAEAPKAEPVVVPAPYVWPVNVIREAQDVVVAPVAPAPVAKPVTTGSLGEWRFYNDVR